MRTKFALLLLTDGRPTMTHAEFAQLRHKSPRTIQNEIYARRNPVPFWKDGAEYLCSVSDVASWLDGQRRDAISNRPHLADFAE